jgi:hypothetical protein
MVANLKDLIDAAQKLSLLEKLDLIRAVSRSLQPSYPEEEISDFWKPLSLEQHLKRQNTPVVTDIAELQAGFWPEDETADDLIAYIYRRRAEDRPK